MRTRTRKRAEAAEVTPSSRKRAKATTFRTSGVSKRRKVVVVEDDETNAHFARLTEALHDNDWDESLALLRGPAAEAAFSHASTSRGRILLRTALCEKAPLAVLEAARRIRPRLFDVDDDDDDDDVAALRRLHDCACLCDDDDVVELLASAAPRATATADPEDLFARVAAHRAVRGRRPPTALRRLLASRPDLARARFRGRALLQVFARTWADDARRLARGATTDDADADVFQRTLSLLLSARERASLDDDDDDALRGLLGLADNDVARAWIPASFVGALLARSARAECAIPDRRGDFPLHLVCARRPFREGV